MFKPFREEHGLQKDFRKAIQTKAQEIKEAGRVVKDEPADGSA
jgi:hypothetical protein